MIFDGGDGRPGPTGNVTRRHASIARVGGAFLEQGHPVGTPGVGHDQMGTRRDGEAA